MIDPVPHELIAEAAEKIGGDVDSWYSWPQVFGSGSGPHGGISGQTMTTFQVFGFRGYNQEGEERAVMWCSGVWRHWRNRDQSWHHARRAKV